MRNGAGKTTTVRILGTLISATAGSAAVAGVPVGPASAGRSVSGSRSCRSLRGCTRVA